MEFDKTYLASGVALEGDIGMTRPNDNVVGVGCSGVGKSLSLEYPTMLHMEDSSMIATFGKKVEALRMAAYFRKKGYWVRICNLDEPDRSDVFYDPIPYLKNSDDVISFSNQIVLSVLKKTNDDYWNNKAKALLSSLVAYARMVNPHAGMKEVLDLFDECTIEQNGDGILCELNDKFDRLRKIRPHCFALREYDSFRMLPMKTAACVRDTLAAALSAVFPECIRSAMDQKTLISFEQLGTTKMALFLICSPVKDSAYLFTNLIYNTAIKQLLSYAQNFDDGKLPQKVRLFFDDFACTAPIEAFPRQISIFRAAGLSAMLLLQSESQLNAAYGKDDATTILNNCSSYVYFPGGMDRETCVSVSQRMNLPLDEVMYAPVGQVFVMRSGNRPVIRERYDILHDPCYQRMMGGFSREKECLAGRMD